MTAENKQVIVISETSEKLAEMIETGLIKALQKTTPQNKIYSFFKAAKQMGISYNTVVRLVESGRINATSDGKFISQQEIDSFLNAKK